MQKTEPSRTCGLDCNWSGFQRKGECFVTMANDYQLRRATLDDVPQLMELWKSFGFPVADLSKHVTEFQVAQTPEGKLVGALGLQIAERHGRVHSEAFGDFALADQLRPLLWDRI